MSVAAGHGASVRIEACGKTFADGTRALEPATLDISRGETLVLLDGVEPVAPARQHLVRVGLMAYVPDQPVIRGIEHIVQGNREFYRTQARGKMPPAGAHAVDQELAQFVGERRQFGGRQAAQIRR